MTLCCKCLKEIPYDEFNEGDFYCLICAGQDDYPLASTPSERSPE